MAFDIFNRKIQWRGSPSVSFTSTGRFSFNKEATAQLENNAVETVLLMWDAEKHLVGVRPITKKDNRAYKVHTGTKGNGAGFSCVTFLRYIGYDLSQSRSMPVKWDETEGIFTIEVPKEYLKKNESIVGNGTKEAT